MTLPVPGPEDLSVMKAVSDDSRRQSKWYEVLQLLRAASIDWSYLAERGAAQGPKRILSLLLYAIDEGIEVPHEAVSRLLSLVADRSEAATSPAR